MITLAQTLSIRESTAHRLHIYKKVLSKARITFKSVREMSDLTDKVIIVTGASSGIGKAVCKSLVGVGAKVVGCARNYEALTKLAEELNSVGEGEMKTVKCDVTEEEDFLNVFKFVEENYGTLHAIVNNAGMCLPEPLLSGSSNGWMKMLKVNVIGLSIGAREAVKLMKKCGVDNGHVVNVNSIGGHVVGKSPDRHFYHATKFAVTALTEGLRQELRAEKSHIRVTAISPGVVKTGFGYNMYPDNPEFVDKFYVNFASLTAEDIAESIIYAMQAPPRVNVSDILIIPTE